MLKNVQDVLDLALRLLQPIETTSPYSHMLNCESYFEFKFCDTLCRHVLTSTINRRYKHTVWVLGHVVEPFFCLSETGDMNSEE